MTKAFDELKKVLKEKGQLTPEDFEKATKEHGEMTEEEKAELSATQLEMEKEKKKKEKKGVTVEEYLEATKTLETAKEGSDEWKKAQEVVKRFEAGE